MDLRDRRSSPSSSGGTSHQDYLFENWDAFYDPFGTTDSLDSSSRIFDGFTEAEPLKQAISKSKPLSDPPRPRSRLPRVHSKSPIRVPVLRHQLFNGAGYNSEFVLACQNRALLFNPKHLGFVPGKIWLDHDYTFGDVVADFFQRKNHQNCRFSHKLFNALRLVSWSFVYVRLVGVSWITPTILKVDKRALARLLGIRSIEGSLFHQQGNFPSHGFVEIGAGDIQVMCPPSVSLSDVDFDSVRLLRHPDGVFHEGCTEADIEQCRWTMTRPGSGEPGFDSP
jgi:hypothetical protein